MSTLLHFTPRDLATTNDATMTEAKNSWSSRLPDLSLAKPIICDCSPSHSAGLRLDKTSNTKVGIQVAALTDARRLESSTRRKTMKAQQKKCATGVIWLNCPTQGARASLDRKSTRLNSSHL